MFVIGSFTSANSKRLTDLSKEKEKADHTKSPAHLILMKSG